MANYATLKAAIAAAIKENGNNEITGSLLQQQLLAMVNSIGSGYQFVGIATPDTNPGTPDQNVFYLASTAGQYTNFGGLVVNDGEFAVLMYNGSWSKVVTGCVTSEQFIKSKQETYSVEDFIKLSTGIQGLNFYQGSVSSSTGLPTTSTTRIYTGFLDNRTHNIVVSLPEGYRFAGIRRYNSTDYSSYVSGETISGRTQTFSEGKYIILIFSKTEQSETISPSDSDNFSLVNDIYLEKKSIVDGKINISDIVDNLDTPISTKPLSAKQGNVLSTRLGDFSDMDEYKYIVPVYTIVNDYWMKGDSSLSTFGTGKQYTSIPVLAGEKYRISGYSTTNVPCCFVKKSVGTDIYLNKESGTYQTFKDQEITILNDGVMYVNGYTAGAEAQRQPLSVEKQVLIEGSARGAIDVLTERIDGMDAFTQLLKSPMPQAYEYRSDDLFVVASKFPGDPNYDLVQIWKKCLQQNAGTYLNTIFTFYAIRKYQNTNLVPDASVVITEGEQIFVQSSDCILATRFCDSPVFAQGSDELYCSGAHAFGYNGNAYKTAESKSVKIYADGKEISVGNSGLANQIDVVVVTDAYDPFALKTSLEGGLTPVYDTLFTETMDYRIQGGCIRCIDSREYKKSANLKAWGGFASMAFSLPYAYFPAGYEFVSAESDGFGLLDKNVTIGVNTNDFDKEDFPDFNHFVKRNASGETFECVYLEGYGVGDHSQIPDNYSMCWVYGSSGSDNRKVYHRVSYETNFSVGDKQRLSCFYGWFKPIVNNANIIAYFMNDLLFIDVKVGYSGTIELPVGFALREFEIVKKTENVTIGAEIASDGIDVSSTGEGYAIIQFK